MYSKAKIAGHPIHPMLVGFPIAFYTATVIALIVYGGTGNPFWYHVGFWTSLAGVVMACAAAVPGLIDLLSLPARSRARDTGIKHAAFNLLTLGLFAIDTIVLGVDWYSTGPLHFGWPLVLGLIGLASMAVAGSLGWKLVQTHHVGVKPTTFATVVHAVEETDDLDELPYSAAIARTADTTARHAVVH
jgi:uncharacterized membrane protein|nr:DUF2231 domain-containing protein [Kofleriaceae bacterium]